MLRLVPVLVVLWACVPQSAPPQANGDSRARAELVGYLRWVGEFQIYRSEAAMRQGLNADSLDCVSGVFSRGDTHDPLSRRFNGRKVRLVGRWENWQPIFEERINGDAIAAGSALLQNACGRERVFIADDAFPAD